MNLDFINHKTKTFVPTGGWKDNATKDGEAEPPPPLDERIKLLEDFIETNSQQTADNWAQCILFVGHIFTTIASILKVIGTRKFSLFPSEFVATNIWGSTLCAIPTGVQDKNTMSIATQVATMTWRFKNVKAKVDALPAKLVDVADYQVLV